MPQAGGRGCRRGVVVGVCLHADSSNIRDVIGGAHDPAGSASDRRARPSRRCSTTKFLVVGRNFLVVDDISSWSNAENLLNASALDVEQAAELGLHIIAGPRSATGSHTSHGSGEGRVAGIAGAGADLDGRREHGQIVSGIFAEL